MYIFILFSIVLLSLISLGHFINKHLEKQRAAQRLQQYFRSKRQRKRVQAATKIQKLHTRNVDSDLNQTDLIQTIIQRCDELLQSGSIHEAQRLVALSLKHIRKATSNSLLIAYQQHLDDIDALQKRHALAILTPSIHKKALTMRAKKRMQASATIQRSLKKHIRWKKQKSVHCNDLWSRYIEISKASTPNIDHQLALLNQVIALDPMHVDAIERHSKLALSAWQQGFCTPGKRLSNVRDAIGYIDQINPPHSPPSSHLHPLSFHHKQSFDTTKALLYVAAGKYDHANRCAVRILASDNPKNDVAMHYITICYKARNHMLKSADVENVLTGFLPSKGKHAIPLTNSLFKLTNTAPSIASYHQASSSSCYSTLEPPKQLPNAHKSVVEWTQNSTDIVERRLREALLPTHQKPADNVQLDLYYLLLNSLWSEGNQESCYNYANAMYSHNPNDATVPAFLALCLIARADYAAARRLLAHTTQDPYRLPLRYHEALFYLATHNQDHVLADTHRSIILRAEPNYVFMLNRQQQHPEFRIYPAHTRNLHMTISTLGSVNMDCIHKSLAKQLALPLLTHLNTCFTNQMPRSHVPSQTMLSGITSVTIPHNASCRNKMITLTQQSRTQTTPYMQSDAYKRLPRTHTPQTLRSDQQPFLDNLELFKNLHALHQKHTNTTSSGLMQGLREATNSEFPIQGILIDMNGNFYAPLWHGTNADQTEINSILSGGLDIKFAGTNRGTNHGRGIYASPNIQKAMQYTGLDSTNNMIFLLVCLGKKPYISSDLGQPPSTDPSDDPWTSKVFYPNHTFKHWEVITYNNHQHLPLLHLQSRNSYSYSDRYEAKGISSIVQACEAKPSSTGLFSTQSKITSRGFDNATVQCPVM